MIVENLWPRYFLSDRVNVIINNRAGTNAPLIAQKIAGRLHTERQQRLL